jgi:hypothetical protein
MKIAVNCIALGLVVLFVLLSAACSGADNLNDETCRAQTPASSRFAWVYYPGYGCGPQTPTGRGVSFG